VTEATNASAHETAPSASVPISASNMSSIVVERTFERQACPDICG
jgi:hypothetical protein